MKLTGEKISPKVEALEELKQKDNDKYLQKFCDFLGIFGS